ncbi:peptidoglycan-binding protein [Streptomyces sp. NPDC058992]|uniref:peptidoglycan-binding protein n=1 Tax=Streptomyces sp. NPDC058992 TaxID=3346688 RepID=UPI00368B6A0A
MKLISRAEWGARPYRTPNGATPYSRARRGVKLHYLGTAYEDRPHTACAAYVRKIQTSHMDGNGWSDIGYSFVVCTHGYVFEGRGLKRRNSANGNTSLNEQDYAVLLLVGSSGLTKPTDAQLAGGRDAIDYCREHGPAGDWLGGHRDGYATTCPGDAVYAWVKKGAPSPGGAASGEPYTVERDDTLSAIGRKLGVPWKDIATANNIAAPYRIYPGQELMIPGKAPAKPKPKPAPAKPKKPKYEPFPGAGFFMNGDRPALGKVHPIFTAMGERLIARGFGRYYRVGAGPRLGQADVNAYEAYQRSLGFTGADAKWPPGPTSWNKLQVPNT